MNARNIPATIADGMAEAVLAMDELSQDGFGRIRGIANLALLSLETPEGHRSVEALAAALVTICAIADDTKNDISCEAGDVGCGYDEGGWRRRSDALSAFRDSQRKGGAA